MNLIDKTPQYNIPEFVDIDILRLNLELPETLENLGVQKGAEIYKVEREERPEGKIISLSGVSNEFKAGDVFAMAQDLQAKQYRILDIVKTTNSNKQYTNFVYECLTDSDAEVENENGKVFKIARTQSATAEVPYLDAENYGSAKYETVEHTIADYAVFDEVKNSLPFVYDTAKLKFFAKTPGEDGNQIDIAIANASDFNANKYLKSGITLDGQFDYIPEEGQFAVIVFYKNEIVETFIVSFDELAKNDKNEFIFIETLINKQSSYVLVKVNEALPNTIRTSLMDNIIHLSNGSFSEAGKDDLEDAHDTLSNKETIDIDIVICNELHPQAGANLAIQRADCVAYMGVPRSCSVGLKQGISRDSTVAFRKELNIDSKYVALFSNYKYQYLSELGDNRWVNMAGDVAGVKAQSNFNTASWYAAAGLNRGLIKNVVKLAQSFDQSSRDVLYKAGVNPIVAFPNSSPVIWGQKTLQTKASSFDRINVVCLFNYLERSLGNMSKYALFSQNDEFTRSYITSLIKPFLSQVKSGRGISDFLCLCDTSNNTPQIIANNQFVIDIWIRPTYAVEFIHLKFTNVGTNDFSIVTGSAS